MSTENKVISDGRLLRARLSEQVVSLGGVDFTLQALPTSVECYCEDMSTGAASYGRLIFAFACKAVSGLYDSEGNPVRFFDRFLPNGVEQPLAGPGDYWWEEFEVVGKKRKCLPHDVLELLPGAVVRILAFKAMQLNRLSEEEKKDLPSGGDSASSASNAGGIQRAADSPADQGGEAAAPASAEA